MTYRWFIFKGTAFNVDEVKKQINLKSQHAITNIVSSTTSSTPATAASASSQQDQQKKVVVLPARWLTLLMLNITPVICNVEVGCVRIL